MGEEKDIKGIKEKVLGTFDVNGDGQVDIQDVIFQSMKIPGIKVDRDSFLRRELVRYCNEDKIEKAVTYTPLKAEIPQDIINRIADEIIQYERQYVSGISAALGVPGGVAMAATIPADIIQYYGYLLRAAQKLLYLYGFPALNISVKGQSLDSETMNVLILCIGVMYSTAGANNALKGVAVALGNGVEKQLLNKALTKGTLYPIVKNVSKWFGVKMTKEVFAGFFKKAIPVVGGVLGGGITYATFKPCCLRLKKSLQNTRLSNPDYLDEDDFIIDADYEVVEEDINDYDDEES